MPISLARADVLHLSAFEGLLRRELRSARSVEHAAQEFTRLFFEEFGNCVLVRLYLALPFGVLPEPNRASVLALPGAHAAPNSETLVLTLLGTFGLEAEWRDRRRSRGHANIPLLDAAFVQSAPMVARLLAELGLGPELFGPDRAAQVRKLVGGFNGVFFVEDARTARDAQGRFIIPAQDFVQRYAVQSVFGMGGVYLESGSFFSAIVFASERLDRLQAEQFSRLIAVFKGATTLLLARGQVFEPG